MADDAETQRRKKLIKVFFRGVDSCCFAFTAEALAQPSVDLKPTSWLKGRSTVQSWWSATCTSRSVTSASALARLRSSRSLRLRSRPRTPPMPTSCCRMRLLDAMEVAVHESRAAVAGAAAGAAVAGVVMAMVVASAVGSEVGAELDVSRTVGTGGTASDRTHVCLATHVHVCLAVGTVVHMLFVGESRVHVARLYASLWIELHNLLHVRSKIDGLIKNIKY